MVIINVFGSTCEELSQRMARHRRRYKAYLNEKGVHCSSFHLCDEFGVENCKIELVEDHPCSNKEELLKQEGYHIQSNECENKRVAGRTKKEFYLQNKETMDKYKRQWCEENRERVLEEKKKKYI